MFRIFCLVLCSVAVSHQQSISKFSVPDLVEVGGSAELVCEHDVAIPPGYAKWWWTPPGGEKQQLYQRINHLQGIKKTHVNPPFNATFKTSGLDRLVLWDLQPEHTGAFQCEVQDASYTERTLNHTLVVYSMGSGLLLNMTKFEDEDTVQLTCEAVGVAPKPNIVISVVGLTFNTSALHGPENGLYNVFTNATFTEEELEDQEVTCRIAFAEYDIEIPSGLQVISETYHSDAWLATTAAAPAEETSAQATLEAPLPNTPGSSGRASSSWLLFAALAIPAMLLALL